MLRFSVWVGVVAAALTVLVSLDASLQFAYRGAGVHLMLDTVVGLIACLTALMLCGRAFVAPTVDALWTLAGFVVLGVGILVGGALFNAVHDRDFVDLSIWSPLFTGAVGAVLLAIGAVSRRRRVRARHALGVALAGAALACLVIGLLVQVFGAQLRARVPADIAAASSGHPRLAGSGLVVALQVSWALAMAVAAAGFVSRGVRYRDGFASWMGCGCVFLTFARVNYLLFPSLDPQLFYIADLWRVAGFAVFSIAVVVELRRYWRGLAVAAVESERRRIARDLHDGLAQELAFLAAETSGRHARAAQRALDEARRAIAALGSESEERLEVALAETAEELAQRYGLDLTLALEPAPQLGGRSREEIVRIMREALTNAGRHAGARTVSVALAAGDRLELRVEDDGCGFDTSRATPGRFGLVGMAERAAALGGRLEISSVAGEGTSVEFLLPA